MSYTIKCSIIIDEEVISLEKDKDLEYIKNFGKITISKICRDLKIDRGNLLNGRTSKENVLLVKEELKKRLTALDE